MPAIDKLNMYSSSGSSSKIVYEDDNNKFFQNDGFVNSINCHDQGNGKFLIH